MTLEEYIRSLVDQGKTGDHPDFKALYEAFKDPKMPGAGEERIRKIAREYWKERKAAKNES